MAYRWRFFLRNLYVNMYIYSWVLLTVRWRFMLMSEKITNNKQVRNLGEGGNTCLDSPARKADLHKPCGLYPCHRQGGNQVQ